MTYHSTKFSPPTIESLGICLDYESQQERQLFNEILKIGYDRGVHDRMLEELLFTK